MVSRWILNKASGVHDIVLEQLAGIGPIDQLQFRGSKQELAEWKADESDLDDIIHTAFAFDGWGRYQTIAPQQHRVELKRLAEEVDNIDPSTVVEIGSAEGGTLYTWSRYFDDLQTLVSIDLPDGIHGGGYPPEKMKFYDTFNADVDTSFIRGNSQSPKTASTARQQLDGGEIDFLFIDGDHRYEGVRKDFELYSEMVRPGGIVAFHDIVDHKHHPDCEVDRLWEEIQDDYETTEIIAGGEDQVWGGIGVVWM